MFNFPVVRRNQDSNLLGIDNLFDEFLGAPVKLGLSGFEILPAVEVYQQGDNLTVKAEIPGVKAQDLSVNIENDLLTISGEKKQENQVSQKDYYRLETAYGKFERTIKLPEAVKAEEAKAEYKNGVLKIELTKAQPDKKKKIDVEVK